MVSNGMYWDFKHIFPSGLLKASFFIIKIMLRNYSIWLYVTMCVDYLSPGLRFSSWVLQFPSLSGPQLSSWVGEAEAQEWDQVDYWNTSSWVPGGNQKTVKPLLKYSDECERCFIIKYSYRTLLKRNVAEIDGMELWSPVLLWSSSKG